MEKLQHTRLRSALLLLLLCLSLEGVAQAIPEEWEGDTSLFTLSDRLMRLSPSASGVDGASISRRYDLPSGQVLSWQIECHYDKRPSQYNTFSWELFTEQTNDGIYCYTLAPDSHGVAVELSRDYYRRGEDGAKPTETTRLASLTLTNPDRDWRQIILRVDLSETGTLRLLLLTPDEGFRTTDAGTQVGGRLIGRMTFAVRYTSGRMREVAWTVPQMRETAASPEVILLGTTPLPGMRTLLQLDRPIDLTEAVAVADGAEVPLAYGPLLSDLIVGPLLQGSGTARVRIRDLRTAEGDVSALVVEVERESQETAGGDLILSEVMTDPPAVGPLARLPYIELYNPTDRPLRLESFLLRYRKSEYPLPEATLAARGYAVLYPEGFSPSEETGLWLPMADFPAMTGSFALSLMRSDGTISDDVEVGEELYEPGLPKEGRSLERVALRPARWRLSTEAAGGSPGRATRMTPYDEVKRGTLVINELMLSPEPVGEKYIELYNYSPHPVRLQGLYLRYRNSPEATGSAWSLVTQPYTLPSHAYVVLTPYPPALEKVHPISDPSTFVERIDFPSISPTYSAIEIVSRTDRSVIDSVVYRRQWLGDLSSDRSHHALERISPQMDGTKRSAWRKAADAAQGGTPGRRNSVAASDATEATEWPTDPQLSYEMMERLLPVYGEMAVMELFTLSGQPIYRCTGPKIAQEIERLKSGSAPLPTLVYVIRIVFTHPDPAFVPLTYTARWAHTLGM